MNPLLQAKGCCVRTLRLYYQTIECAIGNPETEQTHLEQMHFRNSYSCLLYTSDAADDLQPV